MAIEFKRFKDQSPIERFFDKLRQHAYLETIVIVGLYLGIGFFVDPNDICILQADVSYILVLLAVITLFHGMASGILAMSIVGFCMWYFYEVFDYVEYLVALLMTLLFSEFHYYWNRKIKDAEAESDYRGIKLDELSKAFYTLKISHDQLEKNYVLKPMSLRNSIGMIKDSAYEEQENYEKFLQLLEKAFRISVATVIEIKDDTFEVIAHSTGAILEDHLEDILIQNVLDRKKPIYISDNVNQQSKYIAVIPALEQNTVVGLLLIEHMPFMSFNKENLISISILFEYFFNEVRKLTVLSNMEHISMVNDGDFRFEYHRLYNLKKMYGVNSITLVFKIPDRLMAERMFNSIEKLLRSLDVVTMVNYEKVNYVALLFPFSDKAAAFGFMNRLFSKLDDVREEDFEHMTFDFDKQDLLNKYLSIDYAE